MGSVGRKFMRERERMVKSWFFRRKTTKSYVIKELLDLASFVCDNSTKKTTILEKAWTTDRPVTGHLI
ncbi:hypothetical protein L596_025179 [Steinernema carpocapsae]|uniref:Uncharacterized protein n=1 Tax=Steinernema carpocapsae TaxID=34508 RepID=A0A4U5M718_STECR|nr:hypothetical protein L596_025179 [Steinernema carpocapsae]